VKWQKKNQASTTIIQAISPVISMSMATVTSRGRARCPVNTMIIPDIRPAIWTSTVTAIRRAKAKYPGNITTTRDIPPVTSTSTATATKALELPEEKGEWHSPFFLTWKLT